MSNNCTCELCKSDRSVPDSCVHCRLEMTEDTYSGYFLIDYERHYNKTFLPETNKHAKLCKSCMLEEDCRGCRKTFHVYEVDYNSKYCYSSCALYMGPFKSY